MKQKDNILSLTMECKEANHVIVTSLDIHENYIIVGDILRSIFLYFYDADTNSIEEVARDFRSGMVKDCIMIDNDKYIYIVIYFVLSNITIFLLFFFYFFLFCLLFIYL